MSNNSFIDINITLLISINAIKMATVTNVLKERRNRMYLKHLAIIDINNSFIDINKDGTHLY